MAFWPKPFSLHSHRVGVGRFVGWRADADSYSGRRKGRTDGRPDGWSDWDRPLSPPSEPFQFWTLVRYRCLRGRLVLGSLLF